ncbi:MAG TPA: hypothetical protein VEB40_14480 [Flavipsychrobacter sp.]|nr:hypothetical protein [Flavipsychrobacter sp.]
MGNSTIGIKIRRSKKKMKHRIKKKDKTENAVSKYDIRYIVVHKTGTRQSETINDLDSLPYHYVITKADKLINLRPLQPADGTVEVAMIGGIDKKGFHSDNRNELQNRTLFFTLAAISIAFPEAKMLGADQLYKYGFANPGFNVSDFMTHYCPFAL